MLLVDEEELSHWAVAVAQTPWAEFSCARVTTPRFLRRSNQSGDVLDGREMALHGIGQIGDCVPIQLPVVYATASRAAPCAATLEG